MKSLSLSFVIITVLLMSCKGLKPGSSSFNTPIPREFANRSVFPTDLAGGQRFQDIVGGVVVLKDGDAPLLVSLIRPTGYVATVIPIVDPNTYYKSRIKKGAEAQGSYLTIAAKLSVDEMIDLEIVDASFAGIPFDTDVPFKDILAQAQVWVKSHPKIDPSSSRIWVKEAVLTRTIISTTNIIDADASGTVGPIVKVGTKIYNNNETQNKSIQIGLVAYDIDKLVQQTVASGIVGESKSTLQFASAPTIYSEKMIVNKLEK